MSVATNIFQLFLFGNQHLSLSFLGFQNVKEAPTAAPAAILKATLAAMLSIAAPNAAPMDPPMPMLMLIAAPERHLLNFCPSFVPMVFRGVSGRYLVKNSSQCPARLRMFISRNAALIHDTNEESVAFARGAAKDSLAGNQGCYLSKRGKVCPQRLNVPESEPTIEENGQ